MLVFRKVLRTYQMNDPFSKYLFIVSIIETLSNFRDAFPLSLCTTFIRYLFRTLRF